MPKPIEGTAWVPGSKSITNRALALAALAGGSCRLTNALFADDTEHMQTCLRQVGFAVTADQERRIITVRGQGGRIPASSATLFVGNSGTTARFLTPLLCLGRGTFTIDGVPRMRERPLHDLLAALEQLGVVAESNQGCPPVLLHATGLHGGSCTVRADASSQFLSGLLLSAPSADGAETIITLEGPILSAPYIRMTVQMVRAFGGVVEVSLDERQYRIPGRQVLTPPATYSIEPDASAASYFWAAAAITGGCVRVEGIGQDALQGDVAFVDVLAQMGCHVTYESDAIVVQGSGQLQGVTVDMNAFSDTVMTLAALAPFATTPTRIENVAHIRHKETDRLTAVATELRRMGVCVEERADGLTIFPAEKIIPTTVQTYDDHRMAMAFALVGLRTPGIRIADPGCVAKTFPDYFARLEELVYG